MTSENTTIELAAYEEAFSLLAACLMFPTVELHTAMTDGSLLETFADLNQAISGTRGDSSEANNTAFTKQMTDDLTYEMLRKEYTRLFTHPNEPQIPIYEALFLAKEAGKEEKPLLVVNRTAEELEKLYGQMNCKPNRNEIISADHISAELAFLAQIMHDLAEEDKSKESVASTRAMLGEYCAKHITLWMPSFFSQLAKRANLPEYVAIGLFGKRIFADDIFDHVAAEA